MTFFDTFRSGSDIKFGKNYRLPANYYFQMSDSSVDCPQDIMKTKTWTPRLGDATISIEIKAKCTGHDDSTLGNDDFGEGGTGVKLRVLSYNVWGLPGVIGGVQYKAERMRALSEMIRSRTPYFDILLLQELWMQPDHELLKAAAKSSGLHMTGFRELSNSDCDGIVTPTSCSGLAVISAFPFDQTEFQPYTWKGKLETALSDWELFVGKGVGRVRIIPFGNMTIDIFNTHANSWDSWYRIKQAQELMDSNVKKSTADAVIMGGDLNTTPDMTPGTPYEIIQGFMHNSAEEFFSNEWLQPKLATYANQRNAFSYQKEPTRTLDYIFHKGMNPSTITRTQWFALPLLQTKITKSQGEVSIPLSDHEPLISHIYVKKIG